MYNKYEITDFNNFKTRACNHDKGIHIIDIILLLKQNYCGKIFIDDVEVMYKSNIFTSRPVTTIISRVRRDESSLKSFDVQILVLPRATFLVFNGNNIVACNFARFDAIDVKPDRSPLETEPVARDNNKI